MIYAQRIEVFRKKFRHQTSMAVFGGGFTAQQTRTIQFPE